MTDKHKRITQAQMEIWLENSTTKTYLQCLKWSGEQVEEILGNGSHIDPTNNDLSMNRIHSVLGQKIGLVNASDPTSIFNIHEMLELPKEQEDD